MSKDQILYFLEFIYYFFSRYKISVFSRSWTIQKSDIVPTKNSKQILKIIKFDLQIYFIVIIILSGSDRLFGF